MEYTNQINTAYLEILNNKNLHTICLEYLAFKKNRTFKGPNLYEVQRMLKSSEYFNRLSDTQTKLVWNKLAFLSDKETTCFFKIPNSKTTNLCSEVFFNNEASIKQEEKSMTMTEKLVQKQPAFKQVSFVYGKDIETLTATNLFEAVEMINSEIGNLKGANITSNYVDGEILKLEDALTKVVTKLDTFA